METTVAPGDQSRSPGGPNREAMRADAAAVLSYLQTNERWTLLDLMATPLLGRSLLQIVSAGFSAVAELPAPTVRRLLALAAGRLLAYGGEADLATVSLEDRAALAEIRAAVQAGLR